MASREGTPIGIRIRPSTTSTRPLSPARPLHLARSHAGTRRDLGQGRVTTKDGDEPHDSSKRRCQPGEAVGDGG